jgi:pimeloyl-ACP methyl ester carboxylesterase
MEERKDLRFRKYGPRQREVVLLHGGPGAPGEMAPVARELSSTCGVIEHLQSSDSIEGQVEEVREVIALHMESPVAVIGWSFGAWLGVIFSARHPELVRKLVIVSSGPLQEAYTVKMLETRVERLDPSGRKELMMTLGSMSDPSFEDKDGLLRKLALLVERTDSFGVVPHEEEVLGYDFGVFDRVSREAGALRRSGELLELCGSIKCPVVAIHGEWDPHPYEGIKEPLSRVLPGAKFHLLENCGHYPWYEKDAREEFFNILRSEIS